jgi:hypothetical protein
MTPRLLPTLVLAPLAFLSPLLAQGRPDVRDTPNRPTITRRAEPQSPAPRGGMTDSERERLIRAVRELRQQVDALQKRVDEMSRGGPDRAGRGPGQNERPSRRGPGQDGREDRGAGQRAQPMAGRIAQRIRAMRSAMPMRGPVMRGSMMMRGGAPMQGRMPMPGFSPMQGQPFMPGRGPMQRGGLPQAPRAERGTRGERQGRRGGVAIDVETMVMPEDGIEGEDVRVWVQGPDGLPGPQPMFLRQLMRGDGPEAAELPEPIRVMLQRRGGGETEVAPQLRERIRQRVLEKVEEQIEVEEVEAPQGAERPARRANRRKA